MSSPAPVPLPPMKVTDLFKLLVIFVIIICICGVAYWLGASSNETAVNDDDNDDTPYVPYVPPPQPPEPDVMSVLLMNSFLDGSVKFGIVIDGVTVYDKWVSNGGTVDAFDHEGDAPFKVGVAVWAGTESWGYEWSISFYDGDLLGILVDEYGCGWYSINGADAKYIIPNV